MTRNGWIRVLPLALAVTGVGCTFVDKECPQCECDADDGGAAGGNGGAAAGAGSGGQASPGGGSGGTDGIQAGEGGSPAATLLEGDICTQDAECWGDLSCVFTEAGYYYTVCARRCEIDADCDPGEECITAGRGGEPFCSWRQEQEFQPCGAFYTRHCSDSLRCIYLEPILLGVCYLGCDPAADGSDQCGSGQVCIEDPETGGGVCATRTETGGSCDIRIGEVCGPGDICIGDGVDMSTYFCAQLCSAANPACEQGTCTQFGTSDAEYACL